MYPEHTDAIPRLEQCRTKLDFSAATERQTILKVHANLHKMAIMQIRSIPGELVLFPEIVCLPVARPDCQGPRAGNSVLLVVNDLHMLRVARDPACG